MTKTKLVFKILSWIVLITTLLVILILSVFILSRLVNKNNDVQVIIYTHKDKSKLLNKDIEMFNKQYGNLIIKYTGKVHDRYIIIDNKKLYHLGASIKDLGKKIFSMSELESSIIDLLLMKV